MSPHRLLPPHRHSLRPWLHISPEFGIIPPGETLRLSLTVDVTSANDAAAALTSGRDSLEDIVILRLENGRDYFITVAGEYKKSCFGNSIEFLNACPAPVRDYDPR
jgi:phosphatidylinositol-bisphosphatase